MCAHGKRHGGFKGDPFSLDLLELRNNQNDIYYTDTNIDKTRRNSGDDGDVDDQT